ADSYFVSTLARGVRNHSVDSNCRQNQRQNAEGTGKSSGNALKDTAHLNVVFEGGLVVERQVCVESVNCLRNRGPERLWIAINTRMQDDLTLITLRQRQQHEWSGIVGYASIFSVSSHTNHGAPSPGNLNAFSDRVLAKPITIDQGLVHDY